MFYYTVDIRPKNENEVVDKAEIVDTIESLLSTYKNNGQVVSSFYMNTGEVDQKMFLLVPEENSLHEKFDSIHTKKLKELLTTDLDCSIDISPIGPHSINDAVPGDVSSFILKWGQFSPVLSMDKLIAIPLYYLPKTSPDGSNYQNILGWGRDYEDCYSIWFRSSVNESFFMDQLSNIKSDLNRQGTELASQLSGLTGKKCYYYLFSYSVADVPKQCPNCSLPWQQAGMYEFKCDNCSIVMGDLE